MKKEARRREGWTMHSSKHFSFQNISGDSDTKYHLREKEFCEQENKRKIGIVLIIQIYDYELSYIPLPPLLYLHSTSTSTFTSTTHSIS